MKANQARVLLTGASGGIGRAAAEALVKAGASVMLVGRSAAQLSTQALELMAGAPGSADRVEWRSADLVDPSDLAALGDAASQWGANVVVHNAGLPSFGRLEALTPHDIRQVLDTNLLAPMLLTQALLPHLRRLSQAQVICVGSALGRIGLPGYSVYSASKFGLRGFAEALRRELGDTSVRVQYLGPRSTLTRFNSPGAEAYNRATGAATDTPAIVANALVRLLESKAAEHFLGFPEKLAVRLNGLAPGLLDGAFDRHRGSLPEVEHDATAATRRPTPAL